MKHKWLRKYEFTVFRPDDDWSAWHGHPGVYIFAENTGSAWKAWYVGRTADFAKQPRIPSYFKWKKSKWKKAEAKGATHIHLKKVETLPGRKRLENRLIAFRNPPLNV